MKKKIVLLLLSITLLISLIGCSSNTSSETQITSEESATQILDKDMLLTNSLNINVSEITDIQSNYARAQQYVNENIYIPVCGVSSITADGTTLELYESIISEANNIVPSKVIVNISFADENDLLSISENDYISAFIGVFNNYYPSKLSCRKYKFFELCSNIFTKNIG